ncbi:Uncharacterized protein DAT39_015859, partial [Clarias magur]
LLGNWNTGWTGRPRWNWRSSWRCWHWSRRSWWRSRKHWWRTWRSWRWPGWSRR